MRRMREEIRERHLAGENEGDWPGKQSEKQEYSAEELEGSSKTGQRK